jgi:hypothetical protein
MTIPGIRTNKRMAEQWPSYHDRPERPAHIRGQWPPQAPSIDKHAQLDMPGAWADRGLFGTDENSCPERSRRVDAQAAWLAHIEAGRIEVK